MFKKYGDEDYSVYKYNKIEQLKKRGINNEKFRKALQSDFKLGNIKLKLAEKGIKTTMDRKINLREVYVKKAFNFLRHCVGAIIFLFYFVLFLTA